MVASLRILSVFLMLNFLSILKNAYLVLLIYLHLSLHYSLIIIESTAQEMNLSMRDWYESRVYRDCIVSSLPGIPVLQHFFALFRFLSIDRTTFWVWFAQLLASLLTSFLPATCQLLEY